MPGLRRLAKDGKSAEGGSGYLSDVAPGPQRASDAAEFLDREAIIIHEGEFKSMDGVVKFDPKRLQHVVDVNNERTEQLAKHFGGVDKIPVGEYPRVMYDHEGDKPSKETIGRLIGPFELTKIDIPKLGLKGVPAVKAKAVRFLGKENAARASDGRIHDLSLGISDETDLIDELSTVGEGAAPGARLLSRGKTSKETPMPKIAKKNGDKKRLAAIADAKANLKRLSADLAESRTKLTATSGKIRMAAKRHRLDGELRGLIRMGKMTPAEYKKLKLDDLVQLDDKPLRLALSVFDAREKPVITPGQQGSSDAIEAGELAKQLGKKRLKNETRADLKRLGIKLKAEAEEELSEEKDERGGKDTHLADKAKGSEGEAGSEAHLAEYSKHMGELKKHLEAGNLDEAKKAFELAHKMGLSDKHLALGDADGEGESRFSEMQEQLDSVSAVVSKLAGEVDKILAAEIEEGHEDLAADPGEKKPGDEDGGGEAA